MLPDLKIPDFAVIILSTARLSVHYHIVQAVTKQSVWTFLFKTEYVTERSHKKTRFQNCNYSTSRLAVPCYFPIEWCLLPNIYYTTPILRPQTFKLLDRNILADSLTFKQLANFDVL